MDASEVKSFTRMALLYQHPVIASGLHQVLKLGSGDLRSHPQLRGMEIPDHRAHAPNVVGVTVTDGHRIQPGDSAPPQIGRNNVFANIEFGVSIPQQSPGIDQQRLALGGNHQQRIALADVDGRQLQPPRMQLRRGGAYPDPDRRTAQQQQSSHRQNPVPPHHQQRQSERGCTGKRNPRLRRRDTVVGTLPLPRKLTVPRMNLSAHHATHAAGWASSGET